MNPEYLSIIQKRSRRWTYRLLLAACTLSIANTILAADIPAQPPSDIDNVIVTGHFDKLSDARNAITVAEDNFYARFNELNKDHDFDVVCVIEPSTGTRFKRRVCKPKFFATPEKEDVEALSSKAHSVSGTTEATFIPWANARNKSRMNEFRSKMMQMVKNNPDLLRLLVERSRLEQDYKALVKKKFKNQLIVAE